MSIFQSNYCGKYRTWRESTSRKARDGSPSWPPRDGLRYRGRSILNTQTGLNGSAKLTFDSCPINLCSVLSFFEWRRHETKSLISTCHLDFRGGCAVGAPLAAGQANKQPTKPQPITTNKDRLLIHAVQGQIAPAQVIRGYSTTWDGKAKLAIGNGGINYSLNIGDKVFGWAAADKATVGVAAEATGEDKYNSAWLTHSSIGNEARVLSGKAAGEKGVVIGTSGIYILIHFDATVLDKLAIGDTIQVKACGIGLEINGFQDVFVHRLAPEVLGKTRGQKCRRQARGPGG